MGGSTKQWWILGTLWPCALSLCAGLLSASLLWSCGAPTPAPAPVEQKGKESPTVPDWVVSGRSAAHPDAKFLQAVSAAPITGSPAEARDAAEQKARAALVRVFSSHVHSELRVDELVRAVDEVSRTDLTLEETVRIVGEGTLEGARAAGFHVADGFAHCLLVLDRVAGASELARRIGQLDGDAEAFLRQANSNPTRGASLMLLLQAYDNVRQARIQRVTYAVLAGRGMPRTGDVGESVLAALHSATATLRLAVVSGQGQMARVGGRLQDPIEVRLTEGAGAPIAGVELRFGTDGKARAELAPRLVATDADGRARVEVHAIQGSGERTNIVACGVEGLLTRSLAGPAARCEYLLPTAATTRLLLVVSVSVHGSAHDPEVVRAGLRDALTSGGYALVDEASLGDVLAGVRLDNAPVNELQARLRDQANVLVRVVAKAEDAGMRGEQVRARAQAVIQVIDLGTGAVDEFPSDPADGLAPAHAEAGQRSLVRLGEVLGKAVRARVDRHLGL